jgi:predicted nucleic acid-binding protein
VLGQATIDRFLAGLLAIAEWAEDPQDASGVSSRDPDDDYLLALGDSAQVDVLVSGDRDLTEISDPPMPIETPAQFSRRLG